MLLRGMEPLFIIWIEKLGSMWFTKVAKRVGMSEMFTVGGCRNDLSKS
jgi:hypothetical protein